MSEGARQQIAAKRQLEEEFKTSPPQQVTVLAIHFSVEQLPEQIRGTWSGALVLPSSFDQRQATLFRVRICRDAVRSSRLLTCPRLRTQVLFKGADTYENQIPNVYNYAVKGQETVRDVHRGPLIALTETRTKDKIQAMLSETASRVGITSFIIQFRESSEALSCRLSTVKYITQQMGLSVPQSLAHVEITNQPVVASAPLPASPEVSSRSSISVASSPGGGSSVTQAVDAAEALHILRGIRASLQARQAWVEPSSQQPTECLLM